MHRRWGRFKALQHSRNNEAGPSNCRNCAPQAHDKSNECLALGRLGSFTLIWLATRLAGFGPSNLVCWKGIPLVSTCLNRKEVLFQLPLRESEKIEELARRSAEAHQRLVLCSLESLGAYEAVVSLRCAVFPKKVRIGLGKMGLPWPRKCTSSFASCLWPKLLSRSMASNDSRRRRPEKGFRPYHSVSVPKSMDLVHSFQVWAERLG